LLPDYPYCSTYILDITTLHNLHRRTPLLDLLLIPHDCGLAYTLRLPHYVTLRLHLPRTGCSLLLPHHTLPVTCLHTLFCGPVACRYLLPELPRVTPHIATYIYTLHSLHLLPHIHLYTHTFPVPTRITDYHTYVVTLPFCYPYRACPICSGCRYVAVTTPHFTLRTYTPAVTTVHIYPFPLFDGWFWTTRTTVTVLRYYVTFHLHCYYPLPFGYPVLPLPFPILVDCAIPRTHLLTAIPHLPTVLLIVLFSPHLVRYD